MVYNRHATYH